MGHIAPCAAQKLVTKGLVTGLKIVASNESEKCKACIKAKLTCQEIPKVCQGKCTTKFSQEIQLDLWRPLSIATLGGHKYFISFTDDHSCWTTVCLLQMKDILKAYKAFETWVKKHLDTGIACLHSNYRGSTCRQSLLHTLTAEGLHESSQLMTPLNRMVF